MWALVFLRLIGIWFVLHGAWVILSPGSFVRAYVAIISSPVAAFSLYALIGALGCLVLLSAKALGGHGTGWILALGYLALFKFVVNSLITVFAPTFLPSLTLSLYGSWGSIGRIMAGTINLVLGVLVLWYTMARSKSMSSERP